MNAPLDLRMDKATFLRWMQTQQGRYELVEGRVVMQDTGTRGHSSIGLAFYDALRPRLDRKIWTIHVGQLSVEIGNDVRVADVMVEPTGLARDATACDTPILLVEVVSPSSEGQDFNSKRHLYQSLPSLEAYIIASQDEPRLWVWQRNDDAPRDFPEQAIEISDPAETISLRHLNVAFTLNEIYGHIFPD
jgi:Uma2 family endonuclease